MTSTGEVAAIRQAGSAAHPGSVGSVPRLGHVILYVADLDASVRFYRDVVGLPHRFNAATRSSPTATPGSPCTSGAAPNG